MANPFKFDTFIDGNFFTDRTAEIENIKRLVNGENHLILISSRRFGKDGLYYEN